jgi:hypothetical protein
MIALILNKRGPGRRIEMTLYQDRDRELVSAIRLHLEMYLLGTECDVIMLEGTLSALMKTHAWYFWKLETAADLGPAPDGQGLGEPLPTGGPLAPEQDDVLLPIDQVVKGDE